MNSRIGDLLLRTGVINSDQLAQGQEEVRNHGGFLGTHLVKLGIIEQEDLLSILSEQYSVPIIELENLKFEEDLLKLIPQNLSMKHNVLPIVKKGNVLTVAMIDPSNIVALNDIKFITGLDISICSYSRTKFKEKTRSSF